MDGEFILRILISLPVLLVAVYIAEYFRKPENFFIKRLRPIEGTEYTHSQLVFRALMSALLPTPIMMLGVSIMTSDEAFLEWGSSYITLTIIIGIGLFLGVSSYLYFRLWRYRKLTPAEQQASDPRPLFARRTEPNPRTWLLRGGLIALFIFMGITGIPLLAILVAVATEWL